MMKTMKKLMAVLLAVAMATVLSVSVLAAPTPLKNGTIQVTGDGLKGKAVTAVRMLTANVDDKNTDGNISEGDVVAYEIEAAWQSFFDGQLNKSGATAEEVTTYLEGMKGDNAALVAFAKAAKDAYNADPSAFTSLATTQTGATTNTATFSNLNTGYYLVLPAGGSTKAGRATDAMIVNVPGAKATALTLKTEYPTVDKKVENAATTTVGNKADSAQIGSKVKFTLSAKVPNTAEYNTYVFNFKDILSKGLTLDETSVKVSVNGTALTKTTDYTVATTPNSPATGETTLEVKFADLKKVSAAVAGETMTVEYEATINKDAVIGDAGNTNKVTLEYSNNPNGAGTGTTETIVTKTYVFKMDVFKHAQKEPSKTLPGAVFELQDNAGNVIKLVKDNDTTYHVAGAGEASPVTTFDTVDAGAITINGLQEGTYKLVEKTAPVGYNKLTKPVEVTVKPTYGADGSLTKVEYSKDAGAAAADPTVKIENRTGAVLPETGSIGTIGLTALGVALIVVGIFLTSRKKKEQN